MTEEHPPDVERTEPISIEDFQRELSEKRLENEVQKAEVIEVEPRETPDATNTDKALLVVFETVSGFQAEDWLPMPDNYDASESDLACLVEFTQAKASDLLSLKGQRVPFSEGEVLYSVMRKVLRQEESAVSNWDYDKRMEKAQREVVK